MLSYQCSQLSTSQSIIEVFNRAKESQEKQDIVSVVVLDEVGLAEDSPNLPLKALHPLLEDGTEGADTNATVSYNYSQNIALFYFKMLFNRLWIEKKE